MGNTLGTPTMGNPRYTHHGTACIPTMVQPAYPPWYTLGIPTVVHPGIHHPLYTQGYTTRCTPRVGWGTYPGGRVGYIPRWGYPRGRHIWRFMLVYASLCWFMLVLSLVYARLTTVLCSKRPDYPLFYAQDRRNPGKSPKVGRTSPCSGV